jgi:hypothetical protein
MTAFVGWTIIVLGFGLLSMTLLWPVFRLVRRFRPNAGGLIWAYAAATAGCSIMLWYLVPWAVHELFGRVAP